MRLLSRSEEETKRIGFRLGERLKPRDVVCLYGELGVGKTTMIKGIASALGIDERDITSASFIIIVEHHGRIPLYHVDLYRVTAEEVSDIGLHEYINKEGITVIEWAEKTESELSGDTIDVRIAYEDEGSRIIDIEGIEI